MTGRANVGKSSLLNAILGRRDLLRTSKKPVWIRSRIPPGRSASNNSITQGHTKTLNFYQVGKAPGKVVLVDAPGYGGRGRPEWGELFDHYVDNRKEYVRNPVRCQKLTESLRLRRIFILLNGAHGLNETDAMMLHSLDERVQATAGLKFILQAVITKADMIPENKFASSIAQMREAIAGAAPTCLDPIITSTAKYPYIGIDAVRNTITQASQW